MTGVCICGEPEREHSEAGLRGCLRIGCPCIQYHFDHDEEVPWPPNRER